MRAEGRLSGGVRRHSWGRCYASCGNKKLFPRTVVLRRLAGCAVPGATGAAGSVSGWFPAAQAGTPARGGGAAAALPGAGPH